MRRHPLVLLLLGAALAAPISATAGPSCPGSQEQVFGGPVLTYALSGHDTTGCSPPCYLLGPGFKLDWSLLGGELEVYQSASTGITMVKGSDAYDVLGVPVGTPVSVVATFTVHHIVEGNVNGCADPDCAAWVDAQIQHGAGVVDQSHTSSPSPSHATYTDVLTLPLTIVAGHPETISWTLAGRHLAQGSGYTDSIGDIAFANVPRWAQVYSCWFDPTGPTPARPTTWGRLKSIYR